MAVRPSIHNRPEPRQATPAIVAAEPERVAPVAQTISQGAGYRSPSRVGKRAAVAWLEPAAVKQLGIEAIKREVTVQELLVEAINDWFAANGLPRFDAN